MHENVELVNTKKLDKLYTLEQPYQSADWTIMYNRDQANPQSSHHIHHPSPLDEASFCFLIALNLNVQFSYNGHFVEIPALYK